MNHIPVLLNEVIAVLKPVSGGVYCDVTVGDGGHTAAILEASGPDGRVVALDADAKQVAVSKERLKEFGTRVSVVHSPFSQIDEVAQNEGVTEFNGILFDLGYSSRQLADPSYGLSFHDDANLSLRLGTAGNVTAADWLNRASEVEIADALYYYGDRRSARSMARSILHFRRKKQFVTARDVKEALGLVRPSDLAPIWQALRIVVNSEYEEIETALPKAWSLLSSGGVLAVITFHSGEDRLVKVFSRSVAGESAQKSRLIVPSYDEIKRNSRSRSAKLRVMIKK